MRELRKVYDDLKRPRCDYCIGIFICRRGEVHVKEGVPKKEGLKEELKLL